MYVVKTEVATDTLKSKVKELNLRINVLNGGLLRKMF